MSKPACPQCGHADDIRYVEDIQNHRRVVELTAGVLQVEAHYEIGEGWDEGSNGRLFCGACCHEFPCDEQWDIQFLCADEIDDEAETDEEDA
jgi:hypothetical protein